VASFYTMSKEKKKTDKGANTSGKKLSVGRRIARWVGGIVLGLIVFTVLQVMVLKYVPIWRTPLMVRRQIEAKKEGRQFTIHKLGEPRRNFSRVALRSNGE